MFVIEYTDDGLHSIGHVIHNYWVFICQINIHYFIMHRKASTFGKRQNESLTLSCHLLRPTEHEEIAHICLYPWTWMGIWIILEKLRIVLNDISKFPMLMVTK